MDKYTILCTELRESAQSLKGNVDKFREKANKLQKTINKVTDGDYKASDLSSAYAAQSALSGSIARLGEICGAMNTAALQFSEASAELSGRANLTAYYMQHTDTLSYGGLMEGYTAAIASAGSAAAGYELVKNILEENGYAVGSLGSVSNAKNATNTIHDVPASGYAEICSLAYSAEKDKKDPGARLAKMIRESDYIPDNSPLKDITDDQVSFYESSSGFACFVIRDGESAIVVFLGTDPASWGDLAADGTLFFGFTPIQTLEARFLTKQITERYENVVVTGHSLGGHLATDVTLNNKDVDRCVAFEAPGRYDAKLQGWFNKEQYSKITTYNAKGSIISSAVGSTAGKEHKVDVKLNGEMVIDVNHSIKEVRNALFRESHRARAGGGHEIGGR